MTNVIALIPTSVSFSWWPLCVQRKALIVVFQRWFGVAAEEASVASELAAYLREVRKATPSLLAFLVNLADDNGNTVLHYSVSHCNYPIVSLILDTGHCQCVFAALSRTARFAKY